jgi:hypothetical protein
MDEPIMIILLTNSSSHICIFDLGYNKFRGRGSSNIIINVKCDHI